MAEIPASQEQAGKILSESLLRYETMKRRGMFCQELGRWGRIPALTERLNLRPQVSALKERLRAIYGSEGLGYKDWRFEDDPEHLALSQSGYYYFSVDQESITAIQDHEDRTSDSGGRYLHRLFLETDPRKRLEVFPRAMVAMRAFGVPVYYKHFDHCFDSNKHPAGDYHERLVFYLCSGEEVVKAALAIFEEFSRQEVFDFAPETPESKGGNIMRLFTYGFTSSWERLSRSKEKEIFSYDSSGGFRDGFDYVLDPLLSFRNMLSTEFHRLTFHKQELRENFSRLQDLGLFLRIGRLAGLSSIQAAGQSVRVEDSALESGEKGPLLDFFTRFRNLRPGQGLHTLPGTYLYTLKSRSRRDLQDLDDLDAKFTTFFFRHRGRHLVIISAEAQELKTDYLIQFPRLKTPNR